jgi:hypothetical protein
LWLWEKRAGPEEQDHEPALRNALREFFAPSKQTVGPAKSARQISRRRFPSAKNGPAGDQKLTQITADEELR